jgi:PEP-CTERM motif
MKKTMLAFLALVFTLVLTSSAQAAPLCIAANTQVTLTSQIAQGDCDFNGYTFNFQSVNVSATPGPNPPVGTTPGQGATQVLTNAAVNANTNVMLTASSALSLMVQYFANDPATTSWSVPNGYQVTWNYHYDITPIGSVGLVSDVYTATNAYGNLVNYGLGGFKQVTGASGNFQTSMPNIGTANTYHNPSDSLTFAMIQGKIHVEDSLTLSHQSFPGFGQFYAQVGGVGNQGILTNQLTFQSVPEPMTMLLSGAGLLGVGLIRLRKKKA